MVVSDGGEGSYNRRPDGLPAAPRDRGPLFRVSERRR